MSPPPNQVYTVFSFSGFVLCAIPLYWHLEAWNAGTSLYMIWTGLGCLLQCANSIVWNKNMINRAPVYCDISTHIQIALNVAVPASSLCINRQLYRVARMKSAGTTDEEKRRNLIYDLLIGIGIPILQMITGYVVSGNRYNLFEDFGPFLSFWNTPLTYVLFRSWPLAIGLVSLFYCVMAIYAFYKRRQNHMQLTPSANRGRYVRLMTISSIEILGTVPLSTYYIVADVKIGIVPWKGWAHMHGHYSEVGQYAAFIWKNDHVATLDLELFRWSLVGCAFLFFALFGLSDEARERYYHLYKSLARRIGKSTSTPHGAPPATASVPYVKRNTNPIMVQMSRHKDSLSISGSLTAQSSTLSVTMESTLNQDSVTLQDSNSDIMSFYTAKSFDEHGMPVVHQFQLGTSPGLLPTLRPLSVPSAPPPAFLLPVRPASVPSAPPGILPTRHPAPDPSHFSDPIKSTMPDHASSSVETV